MWLKTKPFNGYVTSQKSIHVYPRPWRQPPQSHGALETFWTFQGVTGFEYLYKCNLPTGILHLCINIMRLMNWCLQLAEALVNKKLSYRQATCHVSWNVRNVSRIAFDKSCNRRMTFKVTHGHYKWHESIVHTILSISGVHVVTTCLSCTISLILQLLWCVWLPVGGLTLQSLSFSEHSCD